MELMIIAGKAVPVLQLEHGLAVDRVYTGSFMTSLDMAGIWGSWSPFLQPTTSISLPQLYAGFSISVMKADQAILDRLDAPTKAPNWPVGAEGSFLFVYYCTGLCMGGMR